MAQDNIVEITRCNNARDFLDYLQARNPRWLPDDRKPSPWIFRGQRKAEWKLEPSAMRTTWFDDLKKESYELVKQLTIDATSRADWKPEEYRPDIDTLVELVLQVYAERYAVEEFIELADQVGHTIPEDRRLGFARATINNVIKAMFVHYRREPVPYHFVPATIDFSLAQHHGIPTRLLDWTTMPFAAAFFAADEIVQRQEPGNYDMAVWALDCSRLEDSYFEVVTQRRAKISYLHAQGGLFLCDASSNYHFVQNREWRSIEEAVEQELTEANTLILRKITLPADQADELLYLLDIENITRAHLMPSYDSIKDTLESRRRFLK